ncbi:MAG: hypothetical protein ACPG6B_01060 [Oceanihabitans sp.]
MKKARKNYLLVTALILLFFYAPQLEAQEEQKPPQYYTVTTLHWNMDYDGEEDWLEIEKEFLNKVTKKNEYILASIYFGHRWTNDNSELLLLNVYADWESIDKGNKRNNELAKLAWPDKAARQAYFNKRDAFYATYHSDEIYAVLPGSKHNPAANGKDRILYYQTSHFAFPEDGSQEEFEKLHLEYVNNVINKNDLIVGYYPHAHAWGSDKREFKEAYILNSMSDLIKMNDKNDEISEAFWKGKDEARKEYYKKWFKYTTGFHRDAIYTEITELKK